MFEFEQFEKEYNSKTKYQTYTFEQTVTEYNKICP
jgi:hypothetical protein